MRNYKLELRHSNTDKKVHFGPRKLGDIGRDILIVKNALGSIISYQTLIEEEEEHSITSEGPWFNCSTGTTISNTEAATFDNNMLTYLTKFQLDNQFYILCYLFTKFSVNENFEKINKVKERPFAADPNVESRVNRMSSGGTLSLIPGLPRPQIDDYLNSEYTSTQITLIQRMFEIEFGQLGEATLAVLHGWRPRTIVGPTSYHHDPRVFSDQEFAYDMVLLGLYDSFVKGTLTQKIENTPDLLEPRVINYSNYLGDAPRGIEFLEKYKQQVSAKEAIQISVVGETRPEDYIIKSSYFGALRYRKVSREENSALYSAFERVMEEIDSMPEPALMPEEDYTDYLLRAFEPDPMVDPDPFELDSSRLLFFDKTEYTLENLPPLPDSNQEQISALEDSALTKVLDFYAKPEVWFIDAEDGMFKAIYGYDISILPVHDGRFTTLDKFSIATQNTIQEKQIGTSAEVYTILEEESSEEPLIKFVEFVTPSLRPGDVYRARFIINRHKLSLIKQGINLQVENNQDPADSPPEAGTTPSPADDPTNQELSCEGEQVSKKDQERRYQEYRALAAKRKKEIARTIREKTLENYNNNKDLDNSTVDLGVFGNAQLNLGADSYEYTENVLSAFSDIIDYGADGLYARNDVSSVSNPKISDLNHLKISFADLERYIKGAAKNLRKAYTNATSDGILFKPSRYNGNSEANRLERVVPQLRKFIDDKTKNKDNESTFDFGSTESGNVTAFFNTTSMVEFKFGMSKDGKGLKVTHLAAGGKTLFSPQTGDEEFKKKVKTLTQSLTVGYLAQIEEMSSDSSFLGVFGFSSEQCQKLGIGKLGLAYIVKHTIGVSGTADGEYNPINKWATNNIVDPIERWKEFKQINDLSSQLDVKFGVDEVLSVFGQQCVSFKQFFEEFFNPGLVGKLLCDYVRCIKLPNFSFTIPDFNRDLNIDISIFGWYADLIKKLKELFIALLNQFLCAFAKALIDLLANPFCQEQLRDQLYGDAAGSTGDIKRALIDGLTDMSIRPENVEKSKQLIDEMALFLTGEELCRILQGGPIDAPTMNMILTLADRLGIEEVNTEETLREFFETISIFLPENFCENLNRSTSVIGSASCEETSSFLDQIRRQMLANEATDEEIQRAVDLANKNIIDQARAIEVLGKEGLSGIIPKIMEFGNPDALLNSLPSALSDQINRSLKQIFQPAHTGYVTSLSRYGPSLFSKQFKLPKPGDGNYNAESVIKVQTALQNLRLFTAISAAISQPNLSTLTQQLHVLYQVYEIQDIGGEPVPVFYVRNFDFGDVPQEDLSQSQNFSRIDDLDRLSEYEPKNLFLNPRGFLENNYYFEDPEGKIVNPTGSDLKVITLEGLARPLDHNEMPDIFRPDIVEKTHLEGFSFIGAYKITAAAESRDEVSPSEGTMSFVLERIQDRLAELQSTIQAHLPDIATPINEEEYLSLIGPSLNFSLENERERNRQRRETINVRDFSPPGNEEFEKRIIDLNYTLGRQINSIVLNEFKSTENTNRFDPYTVQINNSPLFRNAQIFEYCDTIPGPGLNDSTITEEQQQRREVFESSIENIPNGIYTRQELFARKFWEGVQNKVDFIYRGQPPGINRDRLLLQSYSRDDNPLRRYFYENQSVDFSEGIFEQIYYSLQSSRLFDVENYYPELQARVAGESYYDVIEECYKNRYNISQFGILSFEKIVTDELEKQMSIELSKPENNPYDRDFDDLDPVQKAIQNVCIIGFARVCIVELMLKGAMAYSVWDLESVSDEPFMQDFVFRFVKEEINRHDSMKDKWKEVITRVTGIEQPDSALKDLVKKQLLKIHGASKKVFQNNPDLDYYNWFIKYFIPQTEVSKRYNFGDPLADNNIRISDESYEVVNAEGNIVDRNGEILPDREVPNKIYWQHPLSSTDNLILSDDDYSRVRNPSEIANNLLRSNNGFFHIEHLIEVWGPLARLETLILPSRQIIERILRADRTDLSEENIERLTRVGSRILRDFEYLNIASAYDRLNLPPINLDDYNLKSTPELPIDSRGTSAEDLSERNREHEVYNIDDFVSGIQSVFNADDFGKAALHYRGLMHYDPDNATPPGLAYRNTAYSAANARPEVIRRTPTRFITKKRRIIKFANDFVSQDHSEVYEIFSPDPQSQLNFVAYRNHLKRDAAGDVFFPNLYEEGNGGEADRLYNAFSQYVTKQGNADTVTYHILTSNGEEILDIEERLIAANPSGNVGIETIKQDNLLREHIKESNDYRPTGPRGEATVQIFFGQPSNRPDDRDFDETRGRKSAAKVRYQAMTLEPGADPVLTRGVSKQTDLDKPMLSTDTLTHRRTQNGMSTTIFQNNYGKQLSLESFNSLKDQYDSPCEETWVETVFEFKDDASLLVGIQGSFSIGETFDPAILEFQPSPAAKNQFHESLRDLIDELHGEGSYNKAYVTSTADEKLTQYGRSIFLRTQDPQRPQDPIDPFYFARPMGIDPRTNARLTSYWLAGDTRNEKFDSAFAPPAGRPDAELREQSKLLVISHTREEIAAGATPTKVVPPNFYKIPMRVLITQVYSKGSTVAREVYCKVVPPDYITNMHNSNEISTQKAKLNTAISQIASEYAEFVDSLARFLGREEPGVVGDRAGIRFTADEIRDGVDLNFPDFCIDFNRNHAAGNNFESPLQFGTPRQYFSIERLYSKVFENEALNINYNSTAELDELFQDRGHLLVDRRRPQTSQDNDNLDTWQYNESCNHFYISDTDITNQNLEGHVPNFHSIIFSLSNVFGWYLNNRRKDTLWGALTRPGPNTLDNGNSFRQEYPIAKTYKVYDEMHVFVQEGGPTRPGDPGSPSNRILHREGYHNLQWAVGVLPNKSYSSFVDLVDGADNMLNINTEENEREELHRQPGFVTLYPGEADVQTAALCNIGDAFYPLSVISKDSYLDWDVHNHDGAPGLILDSLGASYVNYNSVESFRLKKHGSSMFYANGIISHGDISNLFRASMRSLLEEAYEGTIPRVDSVYLFDIQRFYLPEYGNMNVLLSIVEGQFVNDQELFSLNYPVFSSNVRGFIPNRLEISPEKVDQLISSHLAIVTKLFDLTAKHSAFRIQTEITSENLDILYTPYRLGILKRALEHIKDKNEYTATQKLYLFSVISVYDFSDRLIQNINLLNSGSVDLDDVPDEELVDWAVTCLFFLAVSLKSGFLAFDNDELDTNLANLFSTREVFAAGIRLRVYRNAEELAGHDEGPFSNVDFVGGTRGENANIHWNNMRNLVLNQTGDTNMSVKEIIKKTNNAFARIAGEGSLGDDFANAIAGDSYANNQHILNVLLSVKSGNRGFSPLSLIDKFQELWRRSLSRANATVVPASSSVITEQTSNISSLYNPMYSKELHYIERGSIIDFILKLDSQMFSTLFIIPGEDVNLQRGNRVYQFDRQNMSFLIDRLESLYRPKGELETIYTYFNSLISDILITSVQFEPTAAQLASEILQKQKNSVDDISRAWSTQLSLHTGINANVLEIEALQNLIFSGTIISQLFENSKIIQKCRLIANSLIKASPNNDLTDDEREYRSVIENISGPIQEISEEFRSFLMFDSSGNRIFCSPVAETSKIISDFGQGVDPCYDISSLKQDYRNLQPWMAEQLINTDDAKIFFEYIYPVKRYQAVATVFATSILSGHGNMPQIMQTPKASLAALLSLAGMNKKESIEIIDNISQAEFLKQLMDSNASQQSLDCFGFPFPEDFLKQIEEMLKALFEMFPSIFFRGIANVMDPAYKEMRMHYMNCDINKLTLGGLKKGKTANFQDMTAGLVGTEPGSQNLDGKYSSVILNPLIDIPYSIGKGFYGDWDPLGRTLERLVGYIVKGPISLIDGAFSLNIPCIGVDETWPEGQPWNADRYGHPLTPFTLLALATPELPGDKNLRTCAPAQNEPQGEMCPNNGEEPPAFGEYEDPSE